MQVHESLIDLIGNTPLLRLRKVTRHLGSGHSPGTATTSRRARRCWPRWST